MLENILIDLTAAVNRLAAATEITNAGRDAQIAFECSQKTAEPSVTCPKPKKTKLEPVPTPEPEPVKEEPTVETPVEAAEPETQAPAAGETDLKAITHKEYKETIRARYGASDKLADLKTAHREQLDELAYESVDKINEENLAGFLAKVLARFDSIEGK